MKSVLVCGGAGYIGSQAVLALAQAGFRAVIRDNFSNAHPAVLPRLRAYSGQTLPLVQGGVAHRADEPGHARTSHACADALYRPEVGGRSGARGGCADADEPLRHEQGLG